MHIFWNSIYLSTSVPCSLHISFMYVFGVHAHEVSVCIRHSKLISYRSIVYQDVLTKKFRNVLMLEN